MLGACGGSDDDQNQGNQGNPGNSGPVVDGGGSNNGGTTGGAGGATATAVYQAYVRTDKSTQIGGTPQGVTVPVNAGGQILGAVNIGNLSGNLTPTANGGYTSTGSFNNVLTTGAGAIQLCSGGKALFALLPPDAVLVNASELGNRTFQSYENCKQNSSTKLVFNGDGSAELIDGGDKMRFSQADVVKLMGSGISDAEGTTAFRTYKLKTGQYVLVEQGTGEGGRVALWTN